MSDQRYMQLALELAAKGVGRTAPNPPVGAVVVRDARIVGSGFHPGTGQPHAEVFALREAGPEAGGATLYVTLEPCNHQGRTGPCTEAIIAAGIAQVVVGCVDPNPLVSGAGAERLRRAGVTVATGMLERECRHLIAPFAKHVTTGRPHVTLKMAMTLDGQTATSTGDSRWISGEESRLHVHRLRDRVDAVMVGIGTVLADDPQLTTRLPEGGRDPARIVVDSFLRTPVDAKMLSDGSSAPVYLVTTGRADRRKADMLAAKGVEIIRVEELDGRVDLEAAMLELGRRNIQSILLEGGATLAARALRGGIVDRAAVFIAPMFFGGNDGTPVLAGAGCRELSDAIALEDVSVSRLGDDILVEGEVV